MAIKVHVVKYPDRANLVMRYVDSFTGRQVQRSTGTAVQKEAIKAAAKWDHSNTGRVLATRLGIKLVGSFDQFP